MALFERDALRLIDTYIRVGDSVAGPYYVDPTGSGSDSDDGLSQANAWATFAHVNDGTLNAGETVNLMQGTHTDTITPTVTGTLANPITVQAISGQEFTDARGRPKSAANVIIDGESTRTNGIDCLTNVIDYWTFKGFQITGHTGNGANLSNTGTARTGHVLRNMKVNLNASHGVFLDASTNFTLDNLDLQLNGTAEVSGRGMKGTGSTGLLLQYCYGKLNFDDFWRGELTNSTIEFCTSLDNFRDDVLHQDALDIANSPNNVTIRCNWLQDSTIGVYFPPKDDPNESVDNIFIYSNVFVNYLLFDVEANDYQATFLDATANNAQFSNIQIFSNTYLFCGGDAGSAVRIPNQAGTTGDDVRVFNNIFYDCRDDITKTAVNLGSSVTNVTNGYNCYYLVNDTGSGQWANGETGAITSDPSFRSAYTKKTDPGDPFGTQLAMAAGSPCIGTGHPNLASVVTLPASFLDRDGNARTAISGTMGAYEQGSSRGAASIGNVPVQLGNTMGVSAY